MARLFSIYTILILLLAFAATRPAFAEKRVALIIGNSAYQHTTVLPNPTRDADLLAKKLRDLKFEVVLGKDLTNPQFRRILRQFAQKLQTAKTAVFFYAGHGLQVSGRNYLVPIDADIKIAADLRWHTVSLQDIMEEMQIAKRTSVVLLDACRDNPLSRKLARALKTRSGNVGRGLAPVKVGSGMFVGFATAPGEVALDGEGKNSPFSTALAQHIDEQGLDISLMMRRVRKDVMRATNWQQVPWDHSALTGPFYFSPVKSKSKAAVVPTNNLPVLTYQQKAELEYWNFVKDSDDPSELRSYLRQFPKGIFSPLAKFKIEKLEGSTRKDAVARQKKRELRAAEEKKKQAAKKRASAKRKIAAESQKQELLKAKEVARRGQDVLKIAEKKRLTALKATEKTQKEKEATRKAAEEAVRTQLAGLSPDKNTTQDGRARTSLLDTQSTQKDSDKDKSVDRTHKSQPHTNDTERNSKPNAPKIAVLVFMRKVQTELKRLGCLQGKVDGIWGRNSRKAMMNFIRISKIKLRSNKATPKALTILRKRQTKVCLQKQDRGSSRVKRGTKRNLKKKQRRKLSKIESCHAEKNHYARAGDPCMRSDGATCRIRRGISGFPRTFGDCKK